MIVLDAGALFDVVLDQRDQCPLVTTDVRLLGAKPPCEVLVPQQSGSSVDGGP